MAYIRYKTVYTYTDPAVDPSDTTIRVERYYVETWDFDTVKRATLMRPGEKNPVFLRYPDDPTPEDSQITGEVHAECFGTTRRAYMHDGTGKIEPLDAPDSTECGFGGLKWERVQPFGAEPGQTTGRVQLDTVGGLPPVEYAVTGPNGFVRSGQLNEDGWVEVSGLPAATTYEALIADASQPAQRLSQTFTIPAALTAGCTDRTAENFNPNARYEDGTCTYSPPVRTPVFRVPQLNPLRFVLEQATDNSAVFETLDNVLFCQQRRPGQQLRPLFRQKVQYGDVLRLQVHTDFTSVRAEIYRQQTGQLVRTQPAAVAQRLTGLSDPLPVSLREYPGGLTALVSEAGGLPVSLRQAARLTLSGGATGTYRVREVAWQDGEQVLVLSRPWVAAAGEITARWQLNIVNFNAWEVTLNLAGLEAGDYQVKLRASDVTEADVVAVSEPMHLAAEHVDTVVVEYRNRDNAYGMVWTTGMAGRLRLPGTFFRRKPAGSSTLHRSSSGAPTLLASTVQRQVVLETAALPDWLHERLAVVFRLDDLRVQGRRILAPDGYESTELRTFPLSSGQVTLELLDGFGTGNGTDNGALPTTDDTLLELRQGGFLKLH